MARVEISEARDAALREQAFIEDGIRHVLMVRPIHAGPEEDAA